MCKEVNAPVLPASKKVNIVELNVFDLTEQYFFTFNDEFVDVIQMNISMHPCICLQSTPVVHYCCPGCRRGEYLPSDEDQADYKPVLEGYQFNEQDPAKVVEQILDLINRNMPLSIYTYAKGLQSETGQLGIPTMFFADIDSVHRFAGHITHVCEDYYFHEEYLHTIYHSPMYDSDWPVIKSANTLFGELQTWENRLYNRIMMGYTGGGVGVGYISPRTKEMENILKVDSKVEACRGAYGVCLATKSEGPHLYKARRVSYVPHGPIPGEKAKRNHRWLGSYSGDKGGV